MLEARREKLEKREEKEQNAATGKKRSSRRPEKSMFEKVTGSVTGRMIIREVTRGLLGVLGIKSSRR
jgi:hypothetical protein